MSDRTTINVDSEQHKATRKVKDEYNDSWPDVLAFYARHRPTVQVEASEPIDSGSERTELVAEIREQLDRLDSQESSSDGLMQEIKKAQTLAESARDNTEDIKESLR